MEKELNNKRPTLAGHIREYYNIPETDIRTYSPLALAYIGDGYMTL